MSRIEGGAGDPRFFERGGPFSAADVAAHVGADLVDGGERRLTGVAPLQSAATEDLSFLDNRRYADSLAATGAGAVIVAPEMRARVPQGCVALVTREPYLAWARAAAMFHPPPPLVPGVHSTAIIDPTAQIDPTAEIGPFAIVGPRVEIGPRCRIGAHAVLEAGVVIGADARIGSQSTVSHAYLGARVRLYPGVRIGQDGFGFATSASGFVTVPQLGRVILEDDVEVGANTTIDRGSVQDTVIGAGSRLDNLVQIGHNVRLGRCCVIVAQVGISGSTVVGDFVQMAGQAGIAGHLKIGSKARIGGQAGVMADIDAGADVVGSPAMPVRTFFRQVVALARLAERRPSPAGAAKEPGSG